MYAAGAQGNFDALSYHPYQYDITLSQGLPYGDITPVNQLQLMHQTMVANGDGGKLIWSSEYGEPTSLVDENTQAAFISDYLNTWSQFDYAGPSFIYTTRDRQTGSATNDDTYGVLRSDWTRKPAADVIQQWTATHPQTAPDTVTLAAMTDQLAAAATAPGSLTAASPAVPTTASLTTVAPMAATTGPPSTLAAPADATATATTPAPTAVPAATATAATAAVPAVAPAAPSASTAPAATAPTGSTSKSTSGTTGSTGGAPGSTGSRTAGAASGSTDSPTGSSSRRGSRANDSGDGTSRRAARSADPTNRSNRSSRSTG